MTVTVKVTANHKVKPFSLFYYSNSFYVIMDGSKKCLLLCCRCLHRTKKVTRSAKKWLEVPVLTNVTSSTISIVVSQLVPEAELVPDVPMDGEEAG